MVQSEITQIKPKKSSFKQKAGFRVTVIFKAIIMKNQGQIENEHKVNEVFCRDGGFKKFLMNRSYSPTIFVMIQLFYQGGRGEF